MEKAWNEEHKWFGQSYEENGVLDSAVLIMPLVFFMHAVSNTLQARRLRSAHFNRRPVRPEVREHSKPDHEDAREGRLDVQRVFFASGFRERSD